jgi:hypothetical protein
LVLATQAMFNYALYTRPRELRPRLANAQESPPEDHPWITEAHRLTCKRLLIARFLLLLLFIFGVFSMIEFGVRIVGLIVDTLKTLYRGYAGEVPSFSFSIVGEPACRIMALM